MAKKFVWFSALVAIAAGAAGPVCSADLIQGYEQPKQYVVRHQRPRQVVRTAYVDRRKLECAELIVEYRYIPRTEYLRVCNPPVF